VSGWYLKKIILWKKTRGYLGNQQNNVEDIKMEKNRIIYTNNIRALFSGLIFCE
jgi:hypothetical protein